MRRVYVAAPFAARPLALDIAREVITAGHFVTAGWVRATREIDESTVGVSAASSIEEVTEHAVTDLAEVHAADTLIFLTGGFVKSLMPEVKEEWLHTGGRHVEMGYALSMNLNVLILGEPENIFQRSSLCTAYPTVRQVIEALNQEGK